MSSFATVLAIGVVVAAVIAAIVGQRRRPIEDNEDDPNYHTLHSDYQSGMGGGSYRTWKVPKDPQEYAKYFVPKDRKND